MTPAAGRPIGRTSSSGKRAILPWAVATITSSLPVATSTQASSSSGAMVMAMIPLLRTFSNCSSGVFLTTPLRVAMTRNLPALKSGSVIVAIGHLARLHLDAGQVDDRDALGLAARVDDGVDLGREDPAAVGEEERPVVRVGDEEVLDGVFLAGHVADDPLAAAGLAAVGGHRLALDVAAPADRDDDVLVGDQVLVGHLAAGVVGDPGPAGAGVLGLERGQLVLDDGQDARRVGQDVLQLGDELDDLEVLVLDLLALEGGQAGKAHVQDGLGLDLGQPEAGHEVVAGRLDVGRLADGLDDLVEVVERDLEAFEDVGPGAGLLQVELGAAADDLAPVVDVVLQDGLERQRLGLAVDQGEHVQVERDLHRRVLEQVVQDAVRVGVALDLDVDAHAVAVGLVAQVGDALDLLGADELGDLLEQGGLVHHVGQLGDDDRHAAVPGLLEGDLGPDHDSTRGRGRTSRGWRRRSRSRR